MLYMLSRAFRQFYFSFRGRVSRRDYLRRLLLPVCLLPFLLYLLNVFIPLDSYFGLQLLVSMVCLAAFWAFLAVGAKRCHDCGKSALFLFILLVPVVGWIWVILELAIGPGGTGPNKYGEDPEWQ